MGLTEGTEGTQVQKLTFGQQLVGITFNPSFDPQIDIVKQQLATLIDRAHQTQYDPEKAAAQPELTPGDQAYIFATVRGDAIRQLYNAQMALVKLMTLKCNKE